MQSMLHLADPVSSPQQPSQAGVSGPSLPASAICRSVPAVWAACSTEPVAKANRTTAQRSLVHLHIDSRLRRFIGGVHLPTWEYRPDRFPA